MSRSKRAAAQMIYDPLPGWVGSCCRDLLDDAIVLNQRHLKRLMGEYISYHHEDRTHLALSKGTPTGRALEVNPHEDRRVMSMLKVGGLHRRYDLAA